MTVLHRLGVGAPIPETHSLSREAVRLKGQFADKTKKRPREDEDSAAKKEQSEEDEAESRSGAIKKKARLDPFGGKKNKKNKQVTQESRAPLLDSPGLETGSEQSETLGPVTEVGPTGVFLSSPSAHTPKSIKRSPAAEPLHPPSLQAKDSSRTTIVSSTSVKKPNDTPKIGDHSPQKSIGEISRTSK